MKFFPRVPASAALLFLAFPQHADATPNIVYILADDMGHGDPGFAGGKATTPHLDRLAGEGMWFTDAHSSSAVCTPTRYGILTGRYNWRSSLKRGVLWGDSPPLIPESRCTVADVLTGAGYRTGVVGKWHLGLGWEKLDSPREASEGPTDGRGWEFDYSKRVRGGPLSLGFTEDFLFPASLDMPPYVYLRNDKPVGIPTVTKAFKVPNRPGPATPDFEAEDVLGDLARESREFIRRAHAAEEAFFLYLSLTSPHTPIVPADRWQDESGIGEYGDFLMETDWVVGEVLDELGQLGLAADTIVIFTSDNGCSPMADIPDLEKQGHFPVRDLRGHKADIYEGGHRVPFVVRWPGKVKPGSVSDALICTTDFFATAAEIAGVEVDDRSGEDSFSMLPLLTGHDESTRPSVVHHSINGSFAIRRGPWKLCLCPGSGGWSQPKPGKATEGLYPVQLYHLGDDPAEKENLAEEMHDRVVELADHLAEIIRRGRSTPGPDVPNDGWPDTFPGPVLELLPQLGE